MKPETFFTEVDKREILSAISQAESKTSGEIRVHIEKKSGKNSMAKARKVFESLGMRNTALHNGVLFFLAIDDREFVILGDDGINEKVPDDFWNNTKDLVLASFKKGLFVEGLSKGIKEAGEQLSTYFPVQKDDQNELPDAISFSEE